MNDRIEVQYFPVTDPGYLRIGGDDRLEFLQRQTTNDLGLLTRDHPVVTVLTSPAGRILDVLWVMDEGNQTFGVVTLPGLVQRTADFLKSRIFFMDQVSVEAVSQEFIQVEVLTNGIQRLLQEIDVTPDSKELGIISHTLGKAPVRLLIHQEFGCRLLAPHSQAEDILNTLNKKNWLALSPDEYEILRVERGIPAAGHELIEDYTPLEIGYQWAISDSKGCYTGQEVIARQVNFDKITRQLTGLIIQGSPQIGDTLYGRDNRQPVGRITSLAVSPRFGKIGLGVIKRPYHQPGSKMILTKGNQEIEVMATGVPFQ